MDNGSRSGEVMIPLGRGLFAIVDGIDAERLRQFRWCANIKESGPATAYRYERRPDGRYKRIRMHYDIMGKPNRGYVWDHINGNALDNRRRNLRQVTQRQNMQNQHTRRIKNRPVKPKSSKYKGVSYDLVHKKDTLTKPWRARIRVDGILKNIGWFRTEKEAALAYNETAATCFGEFAALNEIEEEV